MTTRQDPDVPASPSRSRLLAAVLIAAVTASSVLLAAPSQAAEAVVIIDDAQTAGSPAFSYSGAWTAGTGLPSASYEGGTEHWTNGGEVSATLTFSGTRAEIVGAKDPGHGYLFASVDGGRETRVDGYAPSRALQQSLFDTGTLPAGDHTVVLRMDGTRNPAANKQGAQLDFARVTRDEPDAGPESAAPTVVPALTRWTGGTGTLALGSTVRVVVAPEDVGTELDGRTVRQEAERLIADLGAAGRTAELVIGAAAPGDVVLSVTAGLADEGYRLTVGDRVTIAASSSAGLFYGGRTLLQSLSGGAELPVGETVDAPGQRLRGGMIDAGRKYWEIGYLKDLIRRMSYQKLNMLTLHVVEAEGFRLDSPAFPGLADPASSYDEAEIRELVAFGAEHHVQIVPGFEFPGHATVISDYFGIGFGDGANACSPSHVPSHLTPNWIIDMTSDTARADSAAILDEFLPWFPAAYVHLGGDEVTGELGNCGRVKDYVAERSDLDTLGDLFVDYVNGVDDAVVANGKRSIIFNGFEHMSRSQQTLNRGVIIQDWQGDGTNPAFAGHDKLWMNSDSVYLTPNNYHNTSPNLTTLTSSWAPRTDADMLGSNFAVWADYNMWAEDEYFEQKMGPLRAAIADRSWNVTARGSAAELSTRLGRIGDAPGVTGFPPRERVGAEAPLHRYPFDPAPYPSGYTSAGSPGQTLFVQDTTGRLNGSTYIIYNPSFIDNGIKGSALSFSHDRQGVGLGGVDLAGPWTMSVWVKQSAAHPDATLLSSREGSAILLRDRTSGKVALATAGGRETFDATLPVGKWVALSLVNDGAETALYFDGEPVDEIEASIPLPLAAIGAWNRSLRGDLDELNIFDAALTPERIAANYERDAAELPQPGLIDYWSFDEDSGVAVDTIGGKDGTLDGAARVPGRHGGGASLTGGESGVRIGASDVSGTWTASLWVKRNASVTSGVLLSGGSSAIKLEQYRDTGKLGFTQFGVADYVIDYSTPLNEWVYLTFTSDGSTLRAYADGEAVGSVAASGNLGRGWIGRLGSGNQLDAAKADVDEVLLYDRALSGEEVRGLFAGFAQGGVAPIGLTAELAFAEPPAEPLELGDVVTAELVLRNPGLVDLRETTVTPRGGELGECAVPARLRAAAELRCPVSFPVTEADVARGSVSLVVDAAATGTNPLATPVLAVSNELTASAGGAARPITATVDGGTPGTLRIGEAFTVDVAGPQAGSTVEVWLHSEPVRLGTATASADGAARIRASLEAGTEPGAHQLVIRATDSTGEAVELSYPVQVLAAEDPGTGPGTGTGPGAEPGSGSGTGQGDGLASTGFAAAAPFALAILLLAAGAFAIARFRRRRA
ncbi:family 20 glycosylhydrolase [Agromyces mediolanus]|uniref:beta-N-acetylhexosaminidase n=1 Tax=Agromyces mediolanus TaxID=41986 RepID=A0A918CA83_AGRME|nr:family 20 glycosylhydrolase [Agromyces mediolanus]GGR13694.1 hypothetical protein GCM10010196_02810 [Agromyces mediolanus]GLJ72685.1 hypothetical protein GCM10017583_19410 [Agromyces mediolanus]